MEISILVLSTLAVIFAAIFFLRISVGILLALIGLVGYAALEGTDRALLMLESEVWATFTDSNLMVIPLFILMGKIAYHSGLCQRLFDCSTHLLGHKKGGIALASLLASGSFSAICGSGPATAVIMSKAVLPEMKKKGYHQGFSSGVVAAGTTLGSITPPSIVAVVIAIHGHIPVQKIFMGGIFPAFLLLALFMATVYIVVRLKPDWAPLEPSTEEGRPGVSQAGLSALLEAFALFSVIIGGMFLGYLSPIEAGALGSILALLLAVLGRSFSFTGMCNAMYDTISLSALLIFMLAGAGIYGRFLLVSGLSADMAMTFNEMALPPFMLLLLICLVYFLGGMFMDALAFALITLPVFLPVMKNAGYDPTWFCIVLLVVTSLGSITPPVGAGAFAVSATGRIPQKDVFTYTALFIPAFIICLIAMTLLPGVFLLLPGKL